MLLLYYNSAAKSSGAGGEKKNQVQGHKNDNCIAAVVRAVQS